MSQRADLSLEATSSSFSPFAEHHHGFNKSGPMALELCKRNYLITTCRVPCVDLLSTVSREKPSSDIPFEKITSPLESQVFGLCANGNCGENKKIPSAIT